MQADCGELQEKLQETLKQQHGQENMIRWLNNQVCHQSSCGHRSQEPMQALCAQESSLNYLPLSRIRQALHDAEQSVGVSCCSCYIVDRYTACGLEHALCRR